MSGARYGRRRMAVAVLGAALAAGAGCVNTQPMVGPVPEGPMPVAPVPPGSPAGHAIAHHGPAPIAVPPPGAVPRELDKITLPPYVIEAPDNLLIEVGIRGQVPQFDATGKQLTKTNGDPLTEEGMMRLPVQAISGPFQVRPDGSIGIGYWGAVTVAGLSLEQAAAAIRQHLIQSPKLRELGTKPENLVVIVDVLAYNSKRYYVITDGGGYGEQVYPFPITGSETVMDAIANINGLPIVASKRNIWVARRCPHPDHPWQILPVDWIGTTQHGITMTNYQIMPGDRIYVKAQRIISFDTALSRILSPVERLFGVTLLGANTVNQIKGRFGGMGGGFGQ